MSIAGHESLTIDCAGRPVREINRAIRSAIAGGQSRLRLLNPAARHNLGVALPEGVHLRVDGPAGYYAAGLNDGATVEVAGGVGWGAAESMRDGTVVIDGDAGNAVAASIRAGTVVVRGDPSTRAGIAMKGGLLIIGGDAGPMAGFMMQKGILVICGDAADSMYAGTVYVGGVVGAPGSDVVEGEIAPDEEAMLRERLDRWAVPAPAGFRKLVSGRRLWNFQRADLEFWKDAL
ncbi:GltB/FmdC/FwdC-like GXGXG domain-containing protein [Tautonia plasticadhaerens]|uniref:GXGXG motif protein n=1 Tax=Tautonia plasticadhaerens TaxID=2527974 RepID=A0A518H1F9_9BACT|nr:glutamate synthase [Tautonia plasticadhaerens]QDV34668.1 GXGXG motif protein [Tautonia plasticadhaerens]